jgi:hypothetical protein
VDRSCVGVAAISWLIACGLSYGVAGGIGTAQADPDSGTVGSSADGPDSPPRVDSNGSGAHQHGGNHRRELRIGDQTAGDDSGGKGVPGDRLGSQRVPGPDNVNNRYSTVVPIWPWPCPLCVPQPVGQVGSPRTTLRGVQAPQSAGGGGGGGSGGGIAVTVPSPTVPGQPGEPTPIQVGGGGHQSPATGGEPATVNMPPVIGLPPMIEAPLRPVGTPGGNGPAAETGAGARPAPAKEPNPVRERPPASVGNATEAPASFRVGYPEYLREARTGEVAALAVPGAVGLFALTALGGVVGYRQARAGHLVRAAGTARFMQ